MGNKRYAPLAAALFLLTLFCWSVSSPIGSGPDADYHLSSIWCGWGESDGICENRGSNGNQYVAEVPFMFQMCNSRPIEYFPECAEVASHPETQFLRTAATPQQNIYYKAMRAFATENPNQSVLMMRFVNSFIASLVLWGLLTFTSGKIRFAALASWTICLVPVSIQYFSSVNPRGWATLAVMSSWAFLAEALSARRKTKQWNFAVLFFLLTALLALMTRIDASAFVLFTSLIVIVWHYQSSGLLNPKRITIGLTSLILLTVIARQFSYLSDRIALNYPVNFPFKQFLLMQITFGPEAIVSAWGYRIGQQGNGPGIIGVIGVSLTAATIAFAFRNSQALQKALISFVVFFMYLVIFRGSSIIQTLVPASGEYILGLTVFLIAMIIYTSHSESQFLERRSAQITCVTLVTFSHILSFYWYFEFYVKRGVSIGVFDDLSLQQRWWWPTQINPNAVFLIGVTSFPLALLTAWKTTEATERVEPLFWKFRSKIFDFVSRSDQSLSQIDKATH
jgi:hypothetical protein